MKKILTQKQIFARLVRMDDSLYQIFLSSQFVCSSEVQDLVESAWRAVYRCCKVIQNA